TKGDRWVRKGETETPRLLQLKKGITVPGKNLYILKFAEIADRNQAETLIGQTLLIPATDRLPLAPGEYHIADLLGLIVYDHQSGDRLGIVTDFYSAGNDLLAVALDEPVGKQVLIPFVEAIVPVVDLDGDRLEIQPPAGLLDL
ncbi:MAG: ribosome maturation factor RimM, partial [Synechocystis sp.]|nr:ribosome maturation factor RimM [Synechocystis sp.]